MQDLRFRQTSQQRAEPLKVLRKTKEEKLRRGEVYNEQNDSRCWDGMWWEVKTEQSVSSYYAFLGICFSTHWWWTAMANGRFLAFLGKDRELPLAENPTFSTLRKIITGIWLIMAHCILYLYTLCWSLCKFQGLCGSKSHEHSWWVGDDGPKPWILQGKRPFWIKFHGYSILPGTSKSGDAYFVV